MAKGKIYWNQIFNRFMCVFFFDLVSAPPPYVSYEQNPPPGGSVSYPTQSLPYPAAGPPQGAPPSVAPPSYSSSVQDPSKGYPQQAGPVPYPQQGIVYPYGQPGYPVQGSATGYTTQGVGAAFNQHTQTTIITQVKNIYIICEAALSSSL